MKEQDRRQIAYWVELLLDDSLSESDEEQLQRFLLNDPDAMDLYLDLMHQNASLQLGRQNLRFASVLRETQGEGGRETDPSSVATSLPNTANSNRILYAMIAALAAGILLILLNSLSPKNDGDEVVAQITDASDAQWGNCTLPTAVGSQLTKGRLKLDRGLATIRFRSGAEVVMEAPADLQIDTPLHGSLYLGTLVVEVPDSAHGFTIETPTAVTIDHGTAFAVTVDPTTEISSIEVLDGEVEVKHIRSKEASRLTENQRIIADNKTLIESTDAFAQEGSELQTINSRPRNTDAIEQITTAMGRGRDATVSRGDVGDHTRSDLVLVKCSLPEYETFSRKAYFGFDLESLAGKRVTSARFLLTLQPSGLGLASRIPDCEFIVYGLTDESLDQWNAKQLDWSNAPANQNGGTALVEDKVLELGRFTVPRGRQHGQVAIEGQQLLGFLNSDTNESVTMIVVRATLPTHAGGLVHGFANRFNTSAPPPTLQITTVNE